MHRGVLALLGRCVSFHFSLRIAALGLLGKRGLHAGPGVGILNKGESRERPLPSRLLEGPMQGAWTLPSECQRLPMQQPLVVAVEHRARPTGRSLTNGAAPVPSSLPGAALTWLQGYASAWVLCFICIDFVPSFVLWHHLVSSIAVVTSHHKLSRFKQQGLIISQCCSQESRWAQGGPNFVSHKVERSVSVRSSFLEALRQNPAQLI